jgi:serine/threonine protein phosphatase PrpC
MLTCPICQSETSDRSHRCDRCGQILPQWLGLFWPSHCHPSPAFTDAYLDPQQRYRRLGSAQPQGQGGDAPPLLSQLVLDCQPQLGSPLNDLQALWLGDPHLDPASLPDAATLPAAALPYLALQADHFPTIPELQDAFEYQNHIVLLLEDRSDWPLLTTAWASPSPDPLQQSQWLFEITLLWQALQPWQSLASLLNPQHWLLNQHHLVCLKQLDPMPGPPPTLQALGQVWQAHLPSPACEVGGQLGHIIEALVKGQLTQIEDLQAELSKPSNPSHPPQRPTPLPSLPALDTPWPAGDDLGASYSSLADWPGDDLGLTDDQLLQLIESQASLANPEETSSAMDLPTMVLPMKLMALEDAGHSHTGQRRTHNEDWYFCQTDLRRVSDAKGVQIQARGLYILCDGMGGHAAGEVASQLAVTTLRDYLNQQWQGDGLPSQELLWEATARANQAIFQANQEKASFGVGRMGTTLLLVLVQDLTMVVVQVGDSRLYSYSKRVGLRQLTVDHEVGQREINRGVEPAIAYARPDAYHLTQALGPSDVDRLSPTIFYSDIAEDTLLILCSDGLSDNQVLERHAATHVAPLLSSRSNLEEGVLQLVDLGNGENGHDNITAILVRVKLRPDLEALAQPGLEDD